MKKILYPIIIVCYLALNSCLLNWFFSLVTTEGCYSQELYVKFIVPLFTSLKGLTEVSLTFTHTYLNAGFFSIGILFLFITYYIVEYKLVNRFILLFNLISLFMVSFYNVADSLPVCALLLSIPMVCGFLVFTQKALKTGGFTKLAYELVKQAKTADHLGYSAQNVSDIFTDTIDQTLLKEGYTDSFSCYLFHCYFKVWIIFYWLGGFLMKHILFIILVPAVVPAELTFYCVYIMVHSIVYTVILVNDDHFYKLGEEYICVNFFKLIGFNSRERAFAKMLFAITYAGLIGGGHLDIFDHTPAECAKKSTSIIIKGVGSSSKSILGVISNMPDAFSIDTENSDSKESTTTVEVTKHNSYFTPEKKRGYSYENNSHSVDRFDYLKNKQKDPLLNAIGPNANLAEDSNVLTSLESIPLKKVPDYVESSDSGKYSVFRKQHGLPDNELTITHFFDIIKLKEINLIDLKKLEITQDHEISIKRLDIEKSKIETQGRVDVVMVDHQLKTVQQDQVLTADKPVKITTAADKAINVVLKVVSLPTALGITGTYVYKFIKYFIFNGTPIDDASIDEASIDDASIEDTSIEDTSIKDNTLSKSDPKVAGGDFIEKDEPKRSSWWWWS